jgi:hypothetical protein
MILTGETDGLGEISVTLPLRAPQIPPGLTWEWTLARAARSQPQYVDTSRDNLQSIVRTSGCELESARHAGSSLGSARYTTHFKELRHLFSSCRQWNVMTVFQMYSFFEIISSTDTRWGRYLMGWKRWSDHHSSPACLAPEARSRRSKFNLRLRIEVKTLCSEVQNVFCQLSQN